MSFAALVASRLRGLYAADDPRLGWLPDAPDAAEAHVRADGRCDLVVGYAGTRFPELDVFVERCAAHAAERGHADHRPAWDRWLAATGTDIVDAGAQLAVDRRRLQVYLRGYYEPAHVARAFAAVGCEASPRLVANALALFGVQTAEMIGLELDDERVGAALYLPIRSIGGERAAALARAIDFLLSALQPPGRARELWGAVAGELLETAVEEHVYVAFDPTPALRWVKIDVGARPLALAGVLARRLGVDAAAMLGRAAELALPSPTHVGLRLGADGAALSVYLPLGSAPGPAPREPR